MNRPAALVRFGPDRRLTALAGLGLLAAAVASALSPDKPGTLLFACAAAVLAAYIAGDLLFWPRLSADGRGLVIRSPLVRARLEWPEVEDVRAVTRVRHGLRGVTLEIDAGELLVVFGRRSLGADPEYVAATLRGLTPER
jgi:hypothetical protein